MSKSDSARRLLALGAAINWAAFLVGLVVSFFMAPYLIRELGDARYGIWCVVEGILAYFTLLDLGIAACLVRFVARHQAANEKRELDKLISACLMIFTVAGGVALLLGLILVAFIAPGLERKLPEPGNIGPFMLVMLGNLALTLPLSVFPTILDGLQRFAAKSAVRLVFLFIRVVGVVIVLRNEADLLPLAIIFTITNLLEHAAMAGLVFWFLPELHISHCQVDRQTLKLVKGYSVDAFLAMLAGRVTLQTGAIIVGGFLTAASAAHYAIAARLIEMAKNLLRSATTTLTPAVSERESRGDHDGVRRILLNGTRWVLYLVMPIHLGILIFGRPFLTRWVGDSSYGEASYPATAILSATLTLGVAQSVAARILYGMGKLKLFARFALVEAGLNFLMSLALVGEYGLEGVAFAVAIPNVLFCLFAIAYACLILELSFWRYLLAAWLAPSLMLILPSAIWICRGPVEPNWLAMVGEGVLGLIPYAIVLVIFELRSKILRLTNRIKKDLLGDLGRIATVPRVSECRQSN